MSNTGVADKTLHDSHDHHDSDGIEVVHRDDYGKKMGMWLFLFTELLLFGGLFLLYMAYRFHYFPQFQLSAKELHVSMGTINTMVLLTSSLTMVLAIVALQRGKKGTSIGFLLSTIGLAGVFLVIKFFEWREKYHHGIFPTMPELLNKTPGEKMFFGLYFTMTGLHGIHVIVGMVILSFMVYYVATNKLNKDNFVTLENAGLYWHLVDLIWIFLFPLFYLLH